MNIAAASAGDEPWIRQLLTLCGLPEEDITAEHLRYFRVMKEKGAILGTVGLEFFGRHALLRSLAVDPRFRGRGFAAELIRKAEEIAVSQKVEALFLLTLTAEDFFAKRGYRRIDRIAAPAEIRETAEFKTLCPANSVCMLKRLGPAPSFPVRNA